MGRMWRLGQEHSVQVFKLVVKNSIEERMVELQHKKLRTAQRVFEASLFNLYGGQTKELETRAELSDLPTQEELDSLCTQECNAAVQKKMQKKMRKTIFELLEQ